jgi:hypothetical protein
VSAFGKANAIVWAVENSSPAVLHAYDASNLATEFYNTSQAASARDHFGNGNKFITPVIANGKVFVGTPNSVAAFGVLRRNNPPLPDGQYNITNGGSGLLMTDYATSPSTSTEIIQYSPYPGLYQTWFLSWQGNGYYLVQNAGSGLYLAAPEGASSAGTAALHAQPTFDATELWALTSTAAGYAIRNESTGLVLGSPVADPNPAAITLQTASSGTNQGWVLQAAK